MVQATTRGARIARTLVGAAGGLVVAVVVTLNLHIWVGFEQGYATTPAEVLDRSIALAVVDVVLLVAGPVLGALVLRGRATARPRATRRDDEHDATG